MKITGLMYEYFFICKRKLWFSANRINLEDENEDVKIGKIIDEAAYKNEKNIF